MRTIIEHIVLIQLPETVSTEQIEGMIQQTKELKGKISGIMDIAQGINFSQRSKGYKVGLTIRFEDRQALEAFASHPEHQKIVNQIKNWGLLDMVVVDFEI